MLEKNKPKSDLITINKVKLNLFIMYLSYSFVIKGKEKKKTDTLF